VALVGDDGQPVSIQGFRISGWSRPQDKTSRETEKTRRRYRIYKKFYNIIQGQKLISAR